MEHHVTPTSRYRPRTLAGLLATLAALALTIGAAVPAAAGGWALGSLDSVPEARAGATEQIGFTILQHGVTPANVDAGSDSAVGIEIVGAGGQVSFFEATQEGPVGHYVAPTTFPEAGDYEWSIRMGWFPAQDLGPLTVAPGGDASTGGAPVWDTARWAVLAAAGVLAAIAAADLLAGRRRSLGVTS